MPLKRKLGPAAVSLAALAAGAALSAQAQAQTSPCDGYGVQTELKDGTRKHKALADTGLQDETSNSAGEHGTLVAEDTGSSGSGACVYMSGDTSAVTISFSLPTDKGVLFAESANGSAKIHIDGGRFQWPSGAVTDHKTYHLARAVSSNSSPVSEASVYYKRPARNSQYKITGVTATQSPNAAATAGRALSGFSAKNSGAGKASVSMINGIMEFGCENNVLDASGGNASSTCHGGYQTMLEASSDNGKAEIIVKNSELTLNTQGRGSQGGPHHPIHAESAGTSQDSGVTVEIDQPPAQSAESSQVLGGSSIKSWSRLNHVIHASASASASPNPTHGNPIGIKIGSSASPTKTTLEVSAPAPQNVNNFVDVVRAAKTEDEDAPRNSGISIEIENAVLRTRSQSSRVIYARQSVAAGAGVADIKIKSGSALIAESADPGVNLLETSSRAYSIEVSNMPATVTIGESGPGASPGDVTITGHMAFSSLADTVIISGGDDGGASPKGVVVTGNIDMGAGNNTLTVEGSWTGLYGMCSNGAGRHVCVSQQGSDTLTLGESATMAPVAGHDKAIVNLTAGAATIRGSGTISAQLVMGIENDVLGGVTGSDAHNGLTLGDGINLGGGNNTMRVKAVTGDIEAGGGNDLVHVAGDVTGGADLGGGDRNTLTVEGAITGDIASAAVERDSVTIGGGAGSIIMGGGANALTFTDPDSDSAADGTWTGTFGNCLPSGTPTECAVPGQATVVVSEGASMINTLPVSFEKGSVIKGAGSLSGNLRFSGEGDTIGGDTGQAAYNALSISGNVALGDGTNTLRAKSVTGNITAGSGQDIIVISESLNGGAILGGGQTDNTMNVSRTVTGNVTSDATGIDSVTIGTADGNINLGNGVNFLTITQSLGGAYTEGTGHDTLTFTIGVTISQNLSFTRGSNTVRGSGTLSGTLEFGGGNDRVGGDPGETALNDLSLSSVMLGNGDNIMRARRATGTITGGSGVDIVELSGSAGGDINLLGGARNTLSVTGSVTGDITSQAAGTGANKDTFTAGPVTGSINLGGGENELTVNGGVSETITVGDGKDTIHLSGNAGGNIILGAGVTDNTLDIEGSLIGEVTSGATGTDRVSVGGGAGDVKLGAGANFLVVDGNWTGKYEGKEDNDTVTVTTGAATGTGDLDLGGGSNSVSGSVAGSGVISGTITMGAGNDTIGTADHTSIDPMLDDNANQLALGVVILGDGNNSVRAASASGTITGGSGIDRIYLGGNAGAEINLGGGATDNAVTVQGTASGDIVSSAIGTDTVSIAGGTGDIRLGNGENRLSISGRWSGNYGIPQTINGQTEYRDGNHADIVTIESGGIAVFPLTLRNGSNTVRGSGVLSATLAFGDGDDMIGGLPHETPFNGLNLADVDLGDGDNTVTAASAAGAITAGDGVDIVTITGTAVGGISLGGGDRNVLSSGGMIEGDVASSASAELDEFTIHSITGNIHLGSGANRLTVSGTMKGIYTGGAGADTILFKPGSNFTGSSFRMGTGQNRLFIEGAPGGDAAKRTLSLSGGAAGNSDSMYICNGQSNILTTACDSAGGNIAFNVELDASGVTGGAWESLQVKNLPSSVESKLSVKGSVTLTDSELNRIRVLGNGATGDRITLSGEYGVTANTVFELDVNTESAASDILIFDSATAMTSGQTFTKTALVDLKALPSSVPAKAGTRIDIVKAKSSDIETVTFSQAPGTNVVTMNKSDWSLQSETSGGETTWFVAHKRQQPQPAPPPVDEIPTTGETPLTPKTEFAGHELLSIADVFGYIVQQRGESIESRQVSYGSSSWSHVILGEREQKLTKNPKYRQKFQAMSAGLDTVLGETGYGWLSQSISLQYGEFEANDTMETTLSGAGYGMEYRTHNGFFMSAGGFYSALETRKMNATKTEYETEGATFSAQIGGDMRASSYLTISPVIKFTRSGYDQIKYDNLMISDMRRASGEFSITFDRAFYGNVYSLNNKSFAGSLQLTIAASEDEEAGFKVRDGSQNPLGVESDSKWAHADLTWMWQAGDSSSFFARMASSKGSGNDYDSERHIFTLGLDSKW